MLDGTDPRPNDNLPLLYIRLLFAYDVECPAKWCTVTVTNTQGQRHSTDLFAQSTYDAAHLYVTAAKSKEAAMMPHLVLYPRSRRCLRWVADGKIFHVRGVALRRWIMKRRQELGGPAGLSFRERPWLD